MTAHFNNKFYKYSSTVKYDNGPYKRESFEYTLLERKVVQGAPPPPTVHLRTNDVTWTYCTSC